MNTDTQKLMMKNLTGAGTHAHTRQPDTIFVLIACEETQRECIAFRERGFQAFSCDIQPCSGKHPEWHVHGDVTRLLSGKCCFRTQDGKYHYIHHWNLIIAHPPCTYLCKLSSVHMFVNHVLQPSRFSNMISARHFFMTCFNAPADFLAVENPQPMAIARLPKPSCYADPSWFGHKYTKKTLYWTRNLPPIMPTYINPTRKSLVNCSRGKWRSWTPWPLARALAQQWGDYILNTLSGCM